MAGECCQLPRLFSGIELLLQLCLGLARRALSSGGTEKKSISPQNLGMSCPPTLTLCMVHDIINCICFIFE